MQCPKCGAEISEQSVYCNRCGERVDTADRESPSVDDVANTSPQPDDDGAAPPAAPGPAQRFKDTAAARTANDAEPEEELWQGGYSSRAMLGTWILAGLLTLAVLAAWILWVRSYWPLMLALLFLPGLATLVLMKYRQWNVRYRLTSQRFFHIRGILRRVTDRIEVIDMDDITLEQGLVERFLGVGTIRVTSSDRTHPELLLRGIGNVREVAEQIDDARRSERRRRGLHIESI